MDIHHHLSYFMDEPTNHLWFFRQATFIRLVGEMSLHRQQWWVCDRTLLNLLLKYGTRKSIKSLCHGGNYEFYRTKMIDGEALQQRIEEKESTYIARKVACERSNVGTNKNVRGEKNNTKREFHALCSTRFKENRKSTSKLNSTSSSGESREVNRYERNQLPKFTLPTATLKTDFSQFPAPHRKDIGDSKRD